MAESRIRENLKAVLNRWNRGLFHRDLVRIRQRFSSGLLILGGVLLLFTIAAYGWMWLVQRRLTAEGQAQTVAASMAVPNDTAAGENSVTLLKIPKINLQAVILEGTNRKSLLLAPGHLQSTAWPGDQGNAVIAAHRDTFFRRVHELGTGDDIYIRRSGREYRYVVSNKSIVAPNDVAVTYPTKDARLTLITCYPTYSIGPAPKRLIVVARLQPAETVAARDRISHAQP